MVLLIWEENPEDVKLLLIPEDEALKHQAHLDEAQGKMIGRDDTTEGMQFVNDAVEGAWAKYRCPDDRPITGVTITRVYKSGFFL